MNALIQWNGSLEWESLPRNFQDSLSRINQSRDVMRVTAACQSVLIGQEVDFLTRNCPHGKAVELIKKHTGFKKSQCYNFRRVYLEYGQHYLNGENSNRLEFSDTVLGILAQADAPQAALEEANSRKEAGEEVTAKIAREIAAAQKAQQEAEPVPEPASLNTGANLAGLNVTPDAMARKMSSREIAELTGKEHFNVCRDIRTLVEQGAFNGFKFEAVKYTDAKGEKRPAYELDFDATMTLVTGYNAVLRAKVIKRWRELEGGTAQKPRGKKGVPAWVERFFPEPDAAPENQVFTFRGQNVRTVIRDGEPWFVVKDVCDVLGIEKYRDAVAALDPDERVSTNMDTLGGKQSMTAVNESGLYALIFKSRKPEAKAFRKWVTSEVLPALRKTGSYAMPKAPEPAPSKTWGDNNMPTAAMLEEFRAWKEVASELPRGYSGGGFLVGNNFGEQHGRVFASFISAALGNSSRNAVPAWRVRRSCSGNGTRTHVAASPPRIVGPVFGEGRSSDNGY